MVLIYPVTNTDYLWLETFSFQINHFFYISFVGNISSQLADLKNLMCMIKVRVMYKWKNYTPKKRKDTVSHKWYG